MDPWTTLHRRRQIRLSFFKLKNTKIGLAVGALDQFVVKFWGACQSLERSSYQLLLLLLKSVEFDDDVALLLSVAGLVMGPRVTS